MFTLRCVTLPLHQSFRPCVNFSINLRCNFICYLRMHTFYCFPHTQGLVSCLGVIENSTLLVLWLCLLTLQKIVFPAQPILLKSFKPEPCLNDGRCPPLVTGFFLFDGSLVENSGQLLSLFSSCPLFVLWLSFTSKVYIYIYVYIQYIFNILTFYFDVQVKSQV